MGVVYPASQQAMRAIAIARDVILCAFDLENKATRQRDSEIQSNPEVHSTLQQHMWLDGRLPDFSTSNEWP